MMVAEISTSQPGETRRIKQPARWPSQVLLWIKHLLPVLLLAVYPAIFHYSNNAANLRLANLGLQLGLYAGIALLVYGVTSLLFRHSAIQAANSAFAWLVIYNLYGLVYGALLKLDRIRVEHYNLLPFFLLLAIYSAWLIGKLREKAASSLWKISALLLAGLALFNIARILPVEISKARLSAEIQGTTFSQPTVADPNRPDIYYIILDEFAGPEAMRQYWQNPEIESFLEFLESKGFRVAEESHASTTNTLHQMAERLNYQPYEVGVPNYQQIWFDAIADNKAMRFLKEQGYTTVVFDEKFLGYPSEPAMVADFSFNYGQIPETQSIGFFNDFGMLVLENTMLSAFKRFIHPTTYAQHIDMLNFTLKKINELEDIESPKFVHVHLMLPHAPFIFNDKGKLNGAEAYHNWNYYLGQYNYSIKVATEMVSNLLEGADPSNPPVIILQSDHGARNKEEGYEGVLANYPVEFKTSILFAIHLPGLSKDEFPPDMDPINTFPLVFNQLFEANLPLK